MCFSWCFEEDLDCKIDHFNATDDWESCEKSHGASDETDLIFNLDLNWNNILYRDMKVTLKKNFTSVSLSISSKEAVSKKIWTSCNVESFSSCPVNKWMRLVKLGTNQSLCSRPRPRIWRPLNSSSCILCILPPNCYTHLYSLPFLQFYSFPP